MTKFDQIFLLNIHIYTCSLCMRLNNMKRVNVCWKTLKMEHIALVYWQAIIKNEPVKLQETDEEKARGI